MTSVRRNTNLYLDVQRDVGAPTLRPYERNVRIVLRTTQLYSATFTSRKHTYTPKEVGFGSKHQLFLSRLSHTGIFLEALYLSKMDSVAIEQYKADSPPTVVRLEIKPHFDALTEQQKRYAHHISRSV